MGSGSSRCSTCSFGISIILLALHFNAATHPFLTELCDRYGV
ncbi:hypothetical protein SLEP1_g31371 [Rubroshorea leprosula]|uniref:Uncharacterized protein n=1 Tax=Rubroshorea leprosula TaxID=152421 RepID=A0AAV5K5E3_9ROSI|nr:hypothetical protein SLEP1_g31371 [Rubroshorea leprosula]